LPVWPTCQSFGRVARVDRGARGAERGAQLVGQRRQHFVELLAGAHRAAARDDDLGGGQFRAIELGDLLADERALARIGDGVDLLDGGRTTRCSGRIEAGRAHGGDLDGCEHCTVAMALPA
jgi:hypothetical protein